MGGPGGLCGHHASTHNVYLNAIIRANHKISGKNGTMVVTKAEPMLRDLENWTLKPSGPGTQLDRGDILVTYLDSDRTDVLDVVIVAPIAKGTSAAIKDGFHAARAHDSKVKWYAARWNHPPAGASGGLVPFAVETGGRMHPTARAWVAQLV